MNTYTSSKKSLPLSLSLGIAPFLDQTDCFEDNFIWKFSLEDQRTFLFNDGNLALICSDPQTKSTYPNSLLISLTVRRALVLKKHSRFPVLIVVKGKKEGELIVKELSRLAPICKFYNMIFGLKNKFGKEFFTQFHTEAEFILLTYNKLRKIVMKKACPATEQIVFVNPLTKNQCHEEIITLDDIIGGLHRHKCRKPHFSYILDTTLFPNLSQVEFSYLLDIDNCLFYQCEEQKRNYYENKLSEKVPYLQEEHIQFFILRELFRGRKSQAQLLEQFKKTITYKFHLYSNNIYPESLTKNNSPFLKEISNKKVEIDKRIYLKLTQVLNLFCKKITKTIVGKAQALENSLEKTLISWEKAIETKPFLPFVEKKKDSKYYLTDLGEALLIATSDINGIETNLSHFLNELSKSLYKDNNPSTKFSIKDIIQFYCFLIRIDPVELPLTFEDLLTNDLILPTAELYESFDRFIKSEFSFILDSFTSFASIQLLGAFEELMDDKAQLFFHRLKDYKKNKKRSWEEKRREAILDLANYKLVTGKLIAQKYKMEVQQAKKELELLESEGLLVCIKTTDCYGSIKLKYCSPELLARFPHLKKNCGSCLFHIKGFKNCTLLHTLQVYNSSSLPSDCQEYIQNPINENATACEGIVDIADYRVEGQKIRFTANIETLSQRMKNISTNFLLGKTNTIKYHCITCQEPIADFGSENRIFFPHKRITCPNCATGYYQKNEETIIIQTEYRHILRMKYYRLAGSIPQILLEKEPSYSLVIYDKESVELDINEDNSYILNICNQKIPLEKVQYLFFAGQGYKSLEESLANLPKNEPEKYHYIINRAKVIENKQEEQTLEQGFSPEQYQLLYNLISYLSDNKIINSSLSKGRHLSNIGGVLYLRRKEIENSSSNQINRQLYEMIDLLMKVCGKVKSSYYGMILEAQSSKYFFELIKEMGKTVGLWTRGRVISRLVKDL
ncbi:MAG TPA: hypothetical protein VMZ29_02000, partial [Candidatus Bathyarchaeia archaeon]|nr:hypothetical protein [Candidatus Bathyarchaeia archaeon]